MHIRLSNILVIFLCSLLALPSHAFEYNKKNALPPYKVGVGLRLQPMEPYLPVAIDFNIERHLGRGFYLGAVWGGGSSHVSNSFGYDTDNPVVKQFDFDPILEYTVVCEEDFKFSLSLITGVSGISLYDGNIYHYRKYSKIYDKDFSDDTYLSIKPGVTFQYKYGFIRFSYGFLQGRTTFASQKDFQGLQICAGFMAF